jgi:nucleotide-binding universal stress UspA family protein
MVQMKTILHPTDFSESSNYALGYAIAFAKQFQSKICLLHVIPAISFQMYSGMSSIPLPSQQVPETALIMADIEKHVRESLEEVLPPEVRGSIPVEYFTRNGVAFLEIIRCANEIKADVIVLGTHGHTGLKHAIIGCVAENVVRKSPCPVFTVRHPEHKFEMPV